MADAGDDAGNDEREADPRAKLMEEVAAQMDAIEADFGEDYEIGNIITVVEIIRPDETGVRVRSSAPYLVGLGMLRVAEKVLDEKG